MQYFTWAIALFLIVFAVVIAYFVIIVHNVNVWLGIPGPICCLAAAVYTTWLSWMPILTISDAGLKFGVWIRPIPWDQIAEVSMGSYFFSKILMIKFTDPKRFMAQRPIFRFFRFCFAPRKEYDFFPSINGLERTPEEIVNIISERLPLKQEN